MKNPIDVSSYVIFSRGKPVLFAREICDLPWFKVHTVATLFFYLALSVTPQKGGGVATVRRTLGRIRLDTKIPLPKIKEALAVLESLGCIRTTSTARHMMEIVVLGGSTNGQNFKYIPLHRHMLKALKMIGGARTWHLFIYMALNASQHDKVVDGEFIPKGSLSATDDDLARGVGVSTGAFSAFGSACRNVLANMGVR